MPSSFPSRLRRVRVALPPVDGRLLIGSLLDDAREDTSELSLLLPPGDISSPEAWNAPLVIGIGQAAAYPLRTFIYDTSSLDRIVSEYVADEMHGICLSDHPGGADAMPLGFVHAGFERSTNDIFRIPRMLYVKYPDGSVWGMLTLEQNENMPSYEDARERLTRPVLRSSDHGSSDQIPLVDGAAGKPGAKPENASISLDAANIIELSNRVALKGMISKAIDTLRGTELSKVVISWRETVPFPKPLALLDVLFSMKANEPDCWLLAFTVGDRTRDGHQGGSDSIVLENAEGYSDRQPEEGMYMIGATPELVLSRAGSVVASSPLAGTLSPQMVSGGIERTDNLPRTPAGDSGHLERLLLDSSKNRLEHSITVDEITSTIDRYCISVAHSRQPGIIRLASIIHLETVITGILRTEMDRPNTTLKLLNDLHPTPAVAGVPREIAMREITELEGRPRNQYAGITGWLAGNGDGFNVLNIRTAVIAGDQVTIQAGAGIIESSDVDDEALEIETKLRSIIRLLPI